MYIETGIGELILAVDVEPEIIPTKCKYMLGGSFHAMNDVYFTKKGTNEDFIKIHEKEQVRVTMPLDVLLFGLFCLGILIAACAMSICVVCKKDEHGGHDEHGGEHGEHEEHGGEHSMHSSLLD